MKLFDQHLHSRHSFDSAVDPVEVCEAAIARGLAGITFTEHFDTHPSEWNECQYDYAAIVAEHARLRERFGDRLTIGTGIEVCYQPERMGFILDYLGARSFDLSVLSIHWTPDGPVHKKPSWQGFTPAEGTRRYLEAVLGAVRFCGELKNKGGSPFQVLGHLDFCKRYTHRWWGENGIEGCGDTIDEILRACLSADLIPEINTSTLRSEVGEPMPAAWVARRYGELGGECMSIGSDAHQAADVGSGLSEAAEIIRDAGLGGLAVFREGSRKIVDLE